MLLLYVTSRLYRLTLIPAFVDESIHLLWSYRLGEGVAEALSAGRLLQILACAIPVRWAADPLWAARAVSVLMGGVTLIAVNRLAVRLGGPRAGLAAALLYLTCPFTFVHDRMALADVFCTAFATLTLLGCLRALESPHARGAIGIGTGMAAAILSKFTGLFVVGWPLCALIGAPRPHRVVRAWTLAYAVAVALITPFVAYFLGTTTEIQQMAMTEAGLLPRLGLLNRNVGLAASWLRTYWTLPMVLLALVPILAMPFRRQWRPVGVLTAAIVVPVVSLGLVAREWFPRYLLPATPPFLILAALALSDMQSAIERAWSGWPRFGWIGLLLLASVPAIRFDTALVTDPLQAPLPSLDREQYLTGWPSGYGFREAVSYLRAQAGTDAALLLLVDRLEQTAPLYAFRAAFMKTPQVEVTTIDVEDSAAHDTLLEAARRGITFLAVSAERLTPARRSVLSRLPVEAAITFSRPDGSVAVAVLRVGAKRVRRDAP